VTSERKKGDLTDSRHSRADAPLTRASAEDGTSSLVAAPLPSRSVHYDVVDSSQLCGYPVLIAEKKRSRASSILPPAGAASAAMDAALAKVCARSEIGSGASVVRCGLSSH
jgi:hypothetical protein